MEKRRMAQADARTLLRSRGVQAVLLATLAIQGFAAVAGNGGGARVASTVAVTDTTVAGDTIREGQPGTTRAVRYTAPDDTLAASLAEKYRQKGFRVPDDLATEIVAAARGNGIEPELAFGLVATESEFKPTAKSPVGAIGLAQLMPATAKLLRPGTTGDDLRDPEINLRLGFRFLHDLLEKYEGDTELALLAYNRGPGIVDRILARGGDPDNGYADKVLGRE